MEINRRVQKTTGRVDQSENYVHNSKMSDEFDLNEVERRLQEYVDTHLSIVRQDFGTSNRISKQAFERILRRSAIPMSDACLNLLWNSFPTTSDSNISFEMFLHRFVPSKLKNQQHDSILLPSKECRILNYVTRISPTIRACWCDIKGEFLSLDRLGRLSVPIDQALNLMKKYSFPLDDNQQRELVLLFSPKKNGQFDYFKFLQYFTTCQSSSEQSNRIVFSRSTFTLQSRQSWSSRPITIDTLFTRIRSQCKRDYDSIHRMFKIADINRKNFLTKIEFNRLLQQFNIRLDENDLYHIMTEIDRNQDALISYDELYDALITSALK